MKDIKEILEAVSAGEMTPDEAMKNIRTGPYEDLGFAKVDLHRKVRQGNSEVIYGESKTPEQIDGIVRSMLKNGQEPVLITRLPQETYEKLTGSFEMKYDVFSRTAVIGELPEKSGAGTIVVATGGTSDIPVAEEAAVTAEFLGNRVERLYDVGVAGMHRLLSNKDVLMDASVIIAVAGMEGALASVIGGMVDCPVVAVPTSVGYGASFGGISALLSMLNSCAGGVSVVNIDNGYGAGYLASKINHVSAKDKE